MGASSPQIWEGDVARRSPDLAPSRIWAATPRSGGVHPNNSERGVVEAGRRRRRRRLGVEAGGAGGGAGAGSGVG
ncbi:UNVERIFIED_CONTAM: hypothetical protein Slati_4196400 [Sesamum latifolium]|uniref:Uncharacterized protein n=1 Tax=Sesamum latifolium TaxID=2727402 RepID=A0AAW2T9S5_9LAMI